MRTLNTFILLLQGPYICGSVTLTPSMVWWPTPTATHPLRTLKDEEPYIGLP